MRPSLLHTERVEWKHLRRYFRRAAAKAIVQLCALFSEVFVCVCVFLNPAYLLNRSLSPRALLIAVLQLISCLSTRPCSTLCSFPWSKHSAHTSFSGEVPRCKWPFGRANIIFGGKIASPRMFFQRFRSSLEKPSFQVLRKGKP